MINVFLNVLDGLIKLKNMSCQDLERGKKNIQSTIGPTVKTRLRDEKIRNAWNELQANPPWSVEQFINDLSGYDNSESVEIIENSK